MDARLETPTHNSAVNAQLDLLWMRQDNAIRTSTDAHLWGMVHSLATVALMGIQNWIISAWKNVAICAWQYHFLDW